MIKVSKFYLKRAQKHIYIRTSFPHITSSVCLPIQFRSISSIRCHANFEYFPLWKMDNICRHVWNISTLAAGFARMLMECEWNFKKFWKDFIDLDTFYSPTLLSLLVSINFDCLTWLCILNRTEEMDNFTKISSKIWKIFEIENVASTKFPHGIRLRTTWGVFVVVVVAWLDVVCVYWLCVVVYYSFTVRWLWIFHSWHILDRGWISDSRKFGVWCGSFKIYCVEPKSTDPSNWIHVSNIYTHTLAYREKKAFINDWIVGDRYQFEKWLQASSNLSSLWNLINKNKPKCLCNVK